MGERAWYVDGDRLCRVIEHGFGTAMIVLPVTEAACFLASTEQGRAAEDMAEMRRKALADEPLPLAVEVLETHADNCEYLAEHYRVAVGEHRATARQCREAVRVLRGER